MGNISRNLEGKLMDAMFHNESYAGGDAIWVALFTTTPDDDGPGTEPGDTYARRQITPTSKAEVAGKTQITNENALEFPVSTESWGTITHIGIFNHETATDVDNYMWWGALEEARTIDANMLLKFFPNELKINLD